MQKNNQDEKIILNQTGKIGEDLYLIDLKQYGASRITSAFCYWDGNKALLMDCGTSDNVYTIIRFLKKNGIKYKNLIGICGSHYHFDHMGGATTLYRRISRKNDNFKIIVPRDTYKKLQDAEDHLTGAKTTFGNFIGKMPPAPEDAFEIVSKDEFISLPLDNSFSLKLISTPGHSPDHCAPTLYRNGSPYFVFGGESCGSLFHSSKLVSVPTSMPPNFSYDSYMENLALLKSLKPELFGFCHYGAIRGTRNIITFINEHKNFMKEWREAIKDAYEDNPSTKYVISKTNSFWEGRFDERLGGDKMSRKFLNNLRLALTYGHMIDLGYRKPKYEKRAENPAE